MPRYVIDWATLTCRPVPPRPRRARRPREDRPLPYRHRARPVTARMVRAEVDGDRKASYLAKRVVIDWDKLEEKVEYYWTKPRNTPPKAAVSHNGKTAADVAAQGIITTEVCSTCGGPVKARYYPDTGLTFIAQCRNGHK